MSPEQLHLWLTIAFFAALLLHSTVFITTIEVLSSEDFIRYSEQVKMIKFLRNSSLFLYVLAFAWISYYTDLNLYLVFGFTAISGYKLQNTIYFFAAVLGIAREEKKKKLSAFVTPDLN